MIGAFESNSWVALLSGTGMVLGVGYSLWLQNRIAFGNVKQYSIIEFKDLTRREAYLLLPFVLLTFIVGLYPNIIICYLKATLLTL
jgi:NADH:ubiquinone oxidoreductase subunit 4 (subunit M)